MPSCSRKGCGTAYTEADNTGVCSYHPGAPVFHEGLKSWSCCQDVSKPVLDFDEFMQIPSCTETQGHTTEVPRAPVAEETPAQNITQSIVDGKETFHVGGHPKRTTLSAAASPKDPVAPAPIVLEEDDLNFAVAIGTVCRRKGCGTSFVSDEVNRQGGGEGTICHYHPLPPFFREGSKGYLCCKRRVLEFDEFLKIKGCHTGGHCFVPVVKESKTEEQVECRIDYYQTPQQVHVSVFAKQVDKARSTVQFERTKVVLNIYLPNNKRFLKTVELFGNIEPDCSSFKILGTKVELQLQKGDGRMWTVLEKTDRDLGGINLTFGVGGRTGTVGGKEIILDEGNKSRG